MAEENERKFLLDRSVFADDKFFVSGHPRSATISQCYPYASKECELRVRRADGKHTLTAKVGTGQTRQEFEVNINGNEYLELSKGTMVLTKLRFNIDGWEIDRYSGDLAGLITAEYEIKDSAVPFEIPEWLKPYILEEITEDEKYKNKNLALKGLPVV